MNIIRKFRLNHNINDVRSYMNMTEIHTDYKSLFNLYKFEHLDLLTYICKQEALMPDDMYLMTFLNKKQIKLGASKSLIAQALNLRNAFNPIDLAYTHLSRELNNYIGLHLYNELDALYRQADAKPILERNYNAYLSRISNNWNKLSSNLDILYNFPSYADFAQQKMLYKIFNIDDNYFSIANTELITKGTIIDNVTATNNYTFDDILKMEYRKAYNLCKFLGLSRQLIDLSNVLINLDCVCANFVGNSIDALIQQFLADPDVNTAISNLQCMQDTEVIQNIYNYRVLLTNDQKTYSNQFHTMLVTNLQTLIDKLVKIMPAAISQAYKFRQDLITVAITNNKIDMLPVNERAKHYLDSYQESKTMQIHK